MFKEEDKKEDAKESTRLCELFSDVTFLNKKGFEYADSWTAATL